MATGNFLDLMPNSTDPTTVITAQNRGAVKLAQAEMGLVAENAKTAVEVLDAQTALAKEEVQTEQVFRTFLAGVSENARQELAGTQQVLDMNQDAYAKKAAEYSQTARDLAETSFFTNPVGFIRNKVKAAGQQSDLVNLVNAMNTAKVHQGEVYAEANQQIRDYNAEVRNLTFAERQIKSLELQQQVQRNIIEQQAKTQTLGAADKALFRQQSIKPDGQDSQDKEYLNNILYRKMYAISRNGDDTGFNLEQSKLQATLFATLPQEDRLALTAGVSRLESLPTLAQEQGESIAAYNQRKLDRDVMVLAETVGTKAVELVSKLGSTSFNQLTTRADEAARQRAMAGISSTIVSPTGVVLPKDPAMLKTEQAQALEAYRNMSYGDKLDAYKAGMGQELTNRAMDVTNPPLDFGGAADLMQAANVDSAVVAAFTSDAVKTAITLPEKRTFKQTADVALSLMDVMQNVVLSNGKKMTDAQSAEVVSKYLKQSFMADYEQNSSEGQYFRELLRLEPGTSLSFGIPTTVPGNKEPINLADPAGVLNLYVQVRRKNTIKEQGQMSQSFMINRGVPTKPLF